MGEKPGQNLGFSQGLIQCHSVFSIWKASPLQNLIFGNFRPKKVLQSIIFDCIACGIAKLCSWPGSYVDLAFPNS